MRPFTFRAQPALDLRCREHDAAQRELARADAERQQARERLEAAERGILEAQREADAAVRGGTSAGDREWYRFWIVRLEQERAARRADLNRRETAVAAARAASLLTRQRREALQRFRQKAYQVHVAAEAARERRMIDELATRRFALRRNNTEGV